MSTIATPSCIDLLFQNIYEQYLLLVESTLAAVLGVDRERRPRARMCSQYSLSVRRTTRKVSTTLGWEENNRAIINLFHVCNLRTAALSSRDHPLFLEDQCIRLDFRVLCFSCEPTTCKQLVGLLPFKPNSTNSEKLVAHVMQQKNHPPSLTLLQYVSSSSSSKTSWINLVCEAVGGRKNQSYQARLRKLFLFGNRGVQYEQSIQTSF